MKRAFFHLLALAALCGPGFSDAADQPQWGHAWSRNMVSSEKGLPDSFDPVTGQNIKWSAKLGTQTFGTPIVGGGRVYIGTNNEEPRDPARQGDRGVLMCFDENTGEFLWQLAMPKREDDPYCDWPKTGMSSPVTIEGDRVYVVNNRGEVMCLDARGMANGNDGPFRDEGIRMMPRGTNAPAVPVQPGPTDADILWMFDLTSGAGIWSHDAAHSSILIHGDHLYLNTGTGVDNTHRVIRTPNAPSLVVLDKRTGRLIGRDDEEIAPNIFHATWSSPAMGRVRGRDLLVFAGGNGVIYGFEPLPQNARSGKQLSSPRAALAPSAADSEMLKLKKVWQFDFDPDAPKENVHQYSGNRRQSPSNIYGMPVLHGERVYVAGGGDPFWGKRQAWLKCIDATASGDITTTGLIWSYPLEKHVLATPAVSDDCVFIADCGRNIHCIDATTGSAHWTHEIRGEVWASPLVADGKVYLGTRSGEFWVFAASREKRILGKVELGIPINATATAANGVLYVATMTHLYAVKR